MVDLGNGIRLMVVTAGAGQGQAQEGASGGLSQVGHQFSTAAILFIEEWGGVVVRSQSQITSGHQSILFPRVPRRS